MIAKRSFYFLLLVLAGCSTAGEKSEPSADEASVSTADYYRSLIAKYPNRPEYYYELGRAYRDAEDWDQAIAAFNQSLALRPNNADVQLGLGYALLYRSQQNLQESEKIFQRILKSYPNYSEASDGLARVRGILRCTRQEEREKIDDRDKPKWVILLQKKAEEAFQQEEYKDAVLLYTQLTERYPNNAGLFYKLGLAYETEGAWTQAITAYQRASHLQPRDADIQLRLGIAYMARNSSRQDLLTAQDIFTAILKKYPDYTDAQVKLRRVRQMLNPQEKTENEVPSWASSLASQAEADVKGEKYEEAIEIYSQLVKALPNQSIYYYKLGSLYEQIQEWDQAIEIYDLLVKLQPKDADAKLRLGIAYLSRNASSNDLQEAKTLFQQVLTDYPHYTVAQEKLEAVITLLSKEEPKVETQVIEEIPSEPKLEEKKEESKPAESTVEMYQHLTNDHPENAAYFYELGLAYSSIGKWDQAIEAYRHSLTITPNDPNVLLRWGFALVFRNQGKDDLLSAQELFQRILKIDPDHKEALDELKKVESMLLTPPEEEKKKSDQAPKIPAWATALEKEADAASKEQDHWRAIELYTSLTQNFPEQSDYFYKLGREYILAECRCVGMELLQTAIELKNDHIDAIVLLAGQYLYFNEVCTSLGLYLRALEFKPDAVEALVGAAKAEVLLDDLEFAGGFYEEALALDPQNCETLRSYVSFLYTARRYCEAEELYRFLAGDSDDPSAYKSNLLDVSAYNRPSFYAKGLAAEEKEKDLFSHQWVASLRYLIAETGIVYPVNECFRLTLRAKTGDTKQRLLVSHTMQFDYKTTGGGVKGEWFIDPFWKVNASLDVEWISNNTRQALLPTRSGTLLEPSLVFQYADVHNTVFFGEITDSIFFRNFNKLQLDVVTRETTFVTYKRDFGDHRWAGVDLLWLWYQDPVKNQEQDVNLWGEVGVPYFEDLLTAGYRCEYRHFYHETTGYYSFQYQLTHWLKLRAFKKWHDTFRYELEYSHGWRTIRGRNPQQQIIVLPTPQLVPVTTVGNEIDQVFLTLGYTPTDYCDLAVIGNYYHDSFDYTAYGIRCALDWRF